MTWILTAVICIILIEVVVRISIPAVLAQMSTVARKAFHTFGSKSISDHWKEKVMLVYACSLFTNTAKLASFLFLICGMVVLLTIVFDYFGANTGDFIVSWVGITFSLSISVLYFIVRKNFV